MSCTAPTSPDTKVIYSYQVATKGRTAGSTSLPEAGGSCSSTSFAAAQATCSATPQASSARSTAAAATAAGCTTTLQQTGKVTKTIVTSSPKPVSSPKPAPKPVSQGTRVITTRATGRESAAALALSEVPFSSGSVGSTPGWRSGALRSRSISPKRKYTPRRGRGNTLTTADACATKVCSSEAPAAVSSLSLPREGSRPREYWTISTGDQGRVSTHISAPAPAAGALKGGEASITVSAPVVARSQVRSTSAEARERPGSVECRAVFMHQGRSWKFSLPPDSSVNEAITTATQQVLRNVVESDHRLGEKLSINVLPSVTDTSTVGEWAHRNLDQPPLIIIKSDLEAGDGVAQQKPELDAQNMQRLMEEQTRLLVALQKQLGEQTSIIRNQASFISELQARDRQQGQLLSESIARIEEDMASMKGQLLTLEECVTKAGNENHGRRGRQ